MRYFGHWIFIYFIICTNLSCGEKAPEINSINVNPKEGELQTGIQTESTKQMVHLLQEIHSKINPQYVSYFNNTKRAEMMKDRYMAENEPVQRMLHKMRYGMELISAGKNENAVLVLESVVNEMKQINYSDLNQFYSANRALAIAYLRVGEIENCLDKSNPKMCLMPLSKEAAFQDKRSVKMAISILKTMLTISDKNEEAIWLLNFAYMALGEYPQSVPPKYLLEPESFKSDYEFPNFPNIASKVNANTRGLSGGSIIDDFNNDGFLDLISTSWDMHDGIQILLNNGHGIFTNSTLQSGLLGITGGLNICQTDYNNDGNLDIFIMRGAWFGQHGKIPNSLLKNLGNGRFSDVTEEVGLLSFYPTQTCIWRDFNLDGLLDVFIANESTSENKNPHEFFIQNSNGTFNNIIHNIPSLATSSYFAKGCAAGDIDNNGLEDIYISNNGSPNQLFLNTSSADKISFKNISEPSNTLEPNNSFPTWFWDFDNDGWEDLFVAEFGQVSKPKSAFVTQNYQGIKNGNQPRIYKNLKDNTFAEQSEKMGITDAIFSMGSNFGDLDNDGFLDFYLGTGSPNFTSIFPNRMFRNNQGESFQDVTTSGGFGHIQKGHGVSFGDIDNDGDQDVFCVLGGAYEGDVANDALFENPGNENAWVTLKLVGETANRLALGARVQVKYLTKMGIKNQYLTVGSGSSFGANSSQLEIGLGEATRIEEVIIKWPTLDKKKTVLKIIELNTFYTIYELGDRVERIEKSKVNF